MKPTHIAYAIWTIIALLGLVCWLMPDEGLVIGDWTLRWPTLAEALDMEDEAIDDGLLAMDEEVHNLSDSAIFYVSNSEPSNVVNSEPSHVADTDSMQMNDGKSKSVLCQPLLAFCQALDSANSMPIRVVHYGDSQIEEDRITNILREQWQKQYGGGGVGLIPLHQTIPTRSIRQWISMDGKVQSVQGGPRRNLVYGPRNMRLSDSDDYGVMGQVAMMDSTLVKGSEKIVLNIEPIDKKRKPHNYFNILRLLTDSTFQRMNVELRSKNLTTIQDTTISSATIIPYSTCNSLYYVLPDSTTHCELHLQGQGAIYGISLETNRGVIVDNIPMRGCSGNIFTKIDSAQLSDFYHDTNTRLIILQFGGNMIPQTENKSTISGYVRSTLRQQVRYIRACAPQASILFIGPSDMSTNIDGTMTTYPLVPYMDKLLKKMTAEENIAYWSMYDAMGGYNSMVTWVEKGLAGSDYVHFTRSGANKIGKQLYNWIETARQQYREEIIKSESADSIHVDTINLSLDSLMSNL